MQKAYDYLNYRQGDFPVSEKVAAEIVSLPMFPNLQPEQQRAWSSEMLRCLRVEMVR